LDIVKVMAGRILGIGIGLAAATNDPCLLTSLASSFSLRPTTTAAAHFAVANLFVVPEKCRGHEIAARSAAARQIDISAEST